MAKQRKTRRQKQLADLRHKHEVPQSTSAPTQDEVSMDTPHSSYTFVTPTKASTSQEKSAAIHHPNLSSNLRKTAIVTVGIILAQVALFFLIK